MDHSWKHFNLLKGTLEAVIQKWRYSIEAQLMWKHSAAYVCGVKQA